MAAKTVLNAWRATRQAHRFIKANDFEGQVRVGFSRTDEPHIRTVFYTVGPVVRERFITALARAGAELPGIREIHRLDRSDTVAHYCAVAVVRHSTPGREGTTG